LASPQRVEWIKKGRKGIREFKRLSDRGGQDRADVSPAEVKVLVIPRRCEPRKGKGAFRISNVFVNEGLRQRAATCAKIGRRKKGYDIRRGVRLRESGRPSIIEISTCPGVQIAHAPHLNAQPEPNNLNPTPTQNIVSPLRKWACERRRARWVSRTTTGMFSNRDCMEERR